MVLIAQDYDGNRLNEIKLCSIGTQLLPSICSYLTIICDFTKQQVFWKTQINKRCYFLFIIYMNKALCPFVFVFVTLLLFPLHTGEGGKNISTKRGLTISFGGGCGDYDVNGHEENAAIKANIF